MGVPPSLAVHGGQYDTKRHGIRVNDAIGDCGLQNMGLYALSGLETADVICFAFFRLSCLGSAYFPAFVLFSPTPNSVAAGTEIASYRQVPYRAQKAFAKNVSSICIHLENAPQILVLTAEHHFTVVYAEVSWYMPVTTTIMCRTHELVPVSICWKYEIIAPGTTS